jgi:hypothetical protein
MNQFMLQTAQLAKTEELLGYDPRQSRAMLLQEQRRLVLFDVPTWGER